MAVEFTPTEAEQAFVIHFSYETFHYPRDTPAINWLDFYGIHWSFLVGFQRWQASHDLDFMNKINHFETLPSFQIPWIDLADFFERVEETLNVYPDLKSFVKELMETRV
jgi:hypothetical protein